METTLFSKQAIHLIPRDVDWKFRVVQVNVCLKFRVFGIRLKLHASVQEWADPACQSVMWDG